MSSVIGSVSKAGISKSVYRILGGPESDQALHEKIWEIVRTNIQGRRVLDTGVGRGDFTTKMWNQCPALMCVTDYEKIAAEKVAGKLRNIEIDASAVIHCGSLDLRAPLGFIEGQDFDLIVCISVLMHMPFEDSRVAIQRLCSHLAPGGRFVLAVLNAEVAKKCFTHAPSISPYAFYPRTKGFKGKEVTEHDIPDDLKGLVEFYFDSEEYRAACQTVCDLYGCQLQTTSALAGERCRGGIYNDIVGDPLWDVYVIDKA